MRKGRGLDALRAQRVRTMALLSKLEPADWDRPCLPGWAVRDVVAHLVATDQASVTGRVLRPLLMNDDRSVVERWNDEAVLRWRDRSPEELMAGLQRWGRRVERVAVMTPGALAQVPVGGPYGRHALVFLLYLRVLDEWVHEQDIAWALGAERDQVPGPPMLTIGEVLAQQVLAVLPRRGLLGVERSVGVVRLVVDPAPPGGAMSALPVVWGVDFARRQFGPRVTARADAEVRVGAAALALVQESRLAWRNLSKEWLAIDGDEDLAAEVLDAVVLNSAPPSGSVPSGSYT